MVNASLHGDDQLRLWQDTRQGTFIRPFVAVDMSADPMQACGQSGDQADMFDPSFVVYEVRVCMRLDDLSK